MKEKILRDVARYFKNKPAPAKFAPGRRIPYGGRVYDEKELVNLVDSSLDFWLTAGKWAAQFERGLGAFVGARHCLLVNSGSSANLLAFATLADSGVAGCRWMTRAPERCRFSTKALNARLKSSMWASVRMMPRLGSTALNSTALMPVGG